MTEKGSGSCVSSLAESDTSTKERLVAAILCIAAIAVPILAVKFPPITDLPQQTAQIRLLFEELGVFPGGPDRYEIQWWHPNKLAYVPLLLGWSLAGPLAAGPVGLLLLGVFWVCAVHFAAMVLGRSSAVASLVTIFFFSKVTYWGFLGFVLGLPIFLIWVICVDRLASTPRLQGLCLLFLSLALYSSHVLWLFAALGWFFVEGIRTRLPLIDRLRRTLWCLPSIALVALWYPSLAGRGFEFELVYGPSPHERLEPSWLVDTLLGGIWGATEPLVLLAVVAWVVVSLLQPVTQLRASAHPGLVLAGLLLLCAGLTLPGILQRTIFFSARWMAPGAVLLLLGLPSPRIGPILKLGIALSVVASLSLVTCNAWRDFEDQELVGLAEALDSLPEESRLLGLDLLRQSSYIRDFPFYHLYSLGQVLRGGTLNESFAQHATSLVVFSDLPQVQPWTSRLDWMPDRVRASDFDHFDYVLLHADSDTRSSFADIPRIRPVTTKGSWWLLQVVDPRTSASSLPPNL